MLDFLQLQANVEDVPASCPPGVVPIVPPPQGPVPPAGNALLAALQPFLGTPYVFGGNSRNGIDCSGLVVQVAHALGWAMPVRTAQTQYNFTSRVSAPEPGDLVFFERTYLSPDRVTHVGWYIGGGWMVSAIEPVVGRQSLGEPFWRSHLVGYGRIARP